MRLLIAYDGSPYADAVLNDLPRAGLSEANDALVLSVAEVALLDEDALSGTSIAEAVLRDMRPQSKEALERARQQAARARDWLKELFPTWHVHALGTAGDAADEIIEKSMELPADLMILGAHGQPIRTFLARQRVD